MLENAGRVGLKVSESDLDMMEAMLDILKVFKTESLKLEAEDTPTIHLVIPSIFELKDTLQPKPADCKSIRNLRANLLSELEAKYVPHERHKLGLFLHPTYRRLRRLPEAERAEVSASVITL